MPLFKPRPPEAKDSRAARLIALTTAGRPRWTPRDYAALASEGFAKNPIAYRCVRMIAEAAAAVPLTVFVGGKRADDHPLRRLLQAPNPEQGGADLMEAFFGHLQVAGNGYLEASQDNTGGDAVPTELYALRPDRMTVAPGPRGWPLAYDYQVAGRTARIGRDASGWLPVLHLRLFNPTDDHYGFSPLEAELGDAHAGTANAGRPLLLEGGLDWRPMSLTPADMDFVEGKHAAAREIALAFGVPPQLLGVPGDATYANYREANGAFWRHTVVPLAERAARALSVWLEPKFPGARVACDLDAVPALSAERDALWARLEGASFLTDAERRRLAGLEG